MKQDKKIYELVSKLINELTQWKDFVDSANPCAYTDRIIEKVICDSGNLKEMYEKNFEEGNM